VGDQIEDLMMAGHRLREARQARVDARRMQDLDALIKAEDRLPNPNTRGKAGRRRAPEASMGPVLVARLAALVQPPRFAAVREHEGQDDLPPAA
jgi:hypothetical protein